MIKIKLAGEEQYNRLRLSFLEEIAGSIHFDEEDIVTLLDFTDETKGKTKGKTKESADNLRKDYIRLYNFLFHPDGDLNRENLRWLLVGPDIMPASLGGNGNGFETMRDSFEKIKSMCPLPSGDGRSEAIKCCQTIFNYKNGFGRCVDGVYRLLRELNVVVCPYCNRMYTITLPSRKELGKEKQFRTTRPVFDHFYPRSKYPYFALSLFNLIPSCHICNGNKRDIAAGMVYPYDEAFGKRASFRLIPDLEKCEREGSIFDIVQGRSGSFEIKFMGYNDITLLKDAPLEYRLQSIENKKERMRIEKSIEVFCLEEIYNEHKEEIMDILKNRYYFNKQYLQVALCPILQRKWKISGDGGKKQIMDIAMDMLFLSRLKEEEWRERPLAKLKSDILEQMS